MVPGFNEDFSQLCFLQEGFGKFAKLLDISVVWNTSPPNGYIILTTRDRGLGSQRLQ